LAILFYPPTFGLPVLGPRVLLRPSRRLCILCYLSDGFPAFAFLLQLTARPGGSSPSPSPSASSLCCVSRFAGFQPDMTWTIILCRVSFCLCSQGLFFLFDLRASDTCTNFEKGGGTVPTEALLRSTWSPSARLPGNPCRARDTPLPDKHTHGRGGCLLYFHENRNYPA
jgi:hypothetical protein